MACIFALSKCIVSQILTKGEKRVFSASQKTLSGRPETGMRHGVMHVPKRMGTLHLSKLTRRQRK